MDFDRIKVVLDVWHASINTPQFAAIHRAAEEELFEHIQHAVEASAEPFLEAGGVAGPAGTPIPSVRRLP